MRADNLVCFVSLDGQPMDAGVQDLYLLGKLQSLTDAQIDGAKVHKNGQTRIIQLPAKGIALRTAEPNDVIECLRSLYNVVLELNLTTFSISKTSIDDVTWITIKQTLLELFDRVQVKMFVCRHEVIIPSPDRYQEIIVENHVSAFVGHKGITKTFRRIRDQYYWPSLKVDVQNYVNSCNSCQTKKLTRVKTRVPMTITDTPGRAFDKVALDIVGPLPTTESGFSYILIMQDLLLTKYSLAAPLQHANATETADAFIRTMICRFGAPKAILTDQGTHFVNTLMRAIAKKFRITHFKTSAFHPQSNGSLERSHHVLVEYLKHYVSQNNWDEWLEYAMFSYNTGVHEGTSFTPHELVFGQIARMPSSDEKQTAIVNESYDAYFQELQTKLQESQAKARENLTSAKIRSKVH